MTEIRRYRSPEHSDEKYNKKGGQFDNDSFQKDLKSYHARWLFNFTLFTLIVGTILVLATSLSFKEDIAR